MHAEREREREREREMTITSEAALAEDFAVEVNNENQLDDNVKRDQTGHDDHAPVGQTELPDTEEHGRRYRHIHTHIQTAVLRKY